MEPSVDSKGTVIQTAQVSIGNYWMSIRVSKTTWRGDLCWILSKNSESLPNLVEDQQISTKSSQRSRDLLHIWSEILSSLPDMDREFDRKGMKTRISVGSTSIGWEKPKPRFKLTFSDFHLTEPPSIAIMIKSVNLWIGWIQVGQFHWFRLDMDNPCRK